MVVTGLDATRRAGVVDMAGSTDVLAAIHQHYGDELAFSLAVGATHWEERDPHAAPLPGPTPEFFFAPGQAAKRAEEWGAEQLQSQIAAAYRGLVVHSADWLSVEHRLGAEGIESTFRALLEGEADPSAGFICSMHQSRLT